MVTNNIRSLLAVAAILAVTVAHRGSAAIYVIDPSLSSITANVFDDATGIPLTILESPGSDTASLSGTVDATVGGGSITLVSTNNLVYANQAIPQMPGPGGGVPTPGTITVSPDPGLVGSGVANFGLQFIVPSGSVLLDPTFPNAAIAGWSDISGAISDIMGTSPIAGGIFSASPFVNTWAAGNLEYNLNIINSNYPVPPDFGLPFIQGSTSLAGASGLNTLAGNGSLIGNTLIIPIYTSGTVSSSGIVVDLVLTGQIVAHAVPEPGTFLLGGLCAIGFVPFVRLRQRPIRHRTPGY